MLLPLCSYFKQQFFAKRGIDNVSANSVVNRMYAFHGSSPCFIALVAYFYTAQIPGALWIGTSLRAIFVAWCAVPLCVRPLQIAHIPAVFWVQRWRRSTQAAVGLAQCRTHMRSA